MRAGRERRAHERAAAPVVVAQHAAGRQRRRGDGALDLSAGMGLLVEQDGVEPGACAQVARRLKPRRSRADHGDVIAIAQVGRAIMRRSPAFALPLSTRMPSRTRIMHACRLPTPSIVTRHSKHTPIMQ